MPKTDKLQFYNKLTREQLKELAAKVIKYMDDRYPRKETIDRVTLDPESFFSSSSDKYENNFNKIVKLVNGGKTSVALGCTIGYDKEALDIELDTNDEDELIDIICDGNNAWITTDQSHLDWNKESLILIFQSPKLK